MYPHFVDVEFRHELRVFVYEPRLAQHVRRRVPQLNTPQRPMSSSTDRNATEMSLFIYLGLLTYLLTYTFSAVSNLGY